MKYILFLFLGFGYFAAYGADTIIPGNSAIVTPAIPASCYDGIRHTKLNAIDQVVLSETNEHVILSYRTFMVDCFYNNGQLEGRIYGPLHSGRCDQTVLPYGGVYTYSKTVKLTDQAPGDKIEVCHTQINFEKSKLQAGDNTYKYVYRHEAIGQYEWQINILYDVTEQKYSQVIAQIPEGTVGNNLDRYTGTKGLVCNYDTVVNSLQGFGIEAPIAKVVGPNLVLTFYALGISCKQEDGKYQWSRDRLKTSDYVIVRNSANSPVGYDWNIFKRPIDKRIVGNYLTFVMPLEEVMEPDQLALLRNGKMATATFKISAVNNQHFGSVGYLNLIVNLDPLAVEN